MGVYRLEDGTAAMQCNAVRYDAAVVARKRGSVSDGQRVPDRGIGETRKVKGRKKGEKDRVG